MKRVFFLGILALFMVFFNVSHASQDITIDDAVRMVVKESQDIKRAEMNVKRMEAIKSHANASRWFQADARANYSKFINMDNMQWWGDGLIPQVLPVPDPNNPVNLLMMPEHTAAVGININQPLFTFGQIGYAVEAARRGVNQAEISKELAMAEIRLAAIQLYWSAKITDEFLRIAENSLRNTRSAQNQLTATGRANRSNLVKISADVAAREIDVQDARFNRDSAFRMLKVYLGLEEEDEIRLTSDLPATFSSIEPKEIKPYEVRVLEEQIKMFEAERWRHNMGYAPTISATAGYDYTTFGWRAEQLGGLYQHNARAGVVLSMPLFDGGSRRAQATGSVMQASMARQELELTRRKKNAEYRDLIQRYGYLRNTFSEFNRAKDLANRAYQLSRDRFLTGQTTAIELADVERGAAGAEMALLNAKLQMLTTAEGIKRLEAGSENL